MRVVQLSDLHFYEHTDLAYYDRVLAEVNALSPDWIVLTGDMIHKGPHYVEQAGEFLRALKAIDSKTICLAVVGNHDYQDEQEGALVQQMVIDSGFQLLINEHWHQPATDNQPSINWVGLDDYYYGQARDVRAVFDDLPKADMTLCLAHNPLHFDKVCEQVPDRVDVMLSGHTHAGHVYIPWLGPIYRHVFHHKYRYAWYQQGNTKLYVTSGVGSAAFYLKAFGLRIGLPRFRWNTNPEIAVFDLAPFGPCVERLTS